MDGHRRINFVSRSFMAYEQSLRVFGFTSALLVFIVGIIHAVDSFAGTHVRLRWSGNLDERNNISYQVCTIPRRSTIAHARASRLRALRVGHAYSTAARVPRRPIAVLPRPACAQEIFLLTPYQIAKHWQPLILGYVVLGQHVAVLHTVSLYSNWWKAGLVYTLLALFGAFGFAGSCLRARAARSRARATRAVATETTSRPRWPPAT